MHLQASTLRVTQNKKGVLIKWLLCSFDLEDA